MISVILNVYKRPYMLEKQIQAIKNQSIPIKSEDIHVWYNKSDVGQYFPTDKKIKTHVCNWNTKFWGRFTLPLLIQTPYVAIFDDDILPQKDWFKNCIETIQKPESNGILGGSGVIIHGRAYHPHNKFGWNGTHSNKAERVDLVGHAWFFRQEWTKYMWYEQPFTWENGEDITFSYLAQKYGNINTFVPPHPENNKDLWCTDYRTANDVGMDMNASWRVANHLDVRGEICVNCIDNGWKTVNNIKSIPQNITNVKVKTFKTDFTKYQEMIKNHKPFAISRNNDGEMTILFNEFIDIRQKLNGEFIYDPAQEQHKFFREKLLESAQYKASNYYVGIACRCCVGNEKHERLKALTGQDEEHLTWGNIFVNSNYPLFVERIVPLFNDYNVVMIVNNKAVVDNLPFANKIVKTFRVGTNAWMSDYKLVDEMKKYIEENKIENHMFLFCAGPFSNILIHECFKSSPNNTYLDTGSTLDNYMNLGATRGYLRGADTLNKICIW